MRLISSFSFIAIIVGLIFSPVKADDISYTSVQQIDDDLQITWGVFGQRWHAFVSKDPYLGNSIPIVDVSFRTGNEVLNRIMRNCYYRGTIVDDFFNPVANTFAYFNVCNIPTTFSEFVSDANSVYLIKESSTSSTGIAMSIDNPNQTVPYLGISPVGGAINNLPDGQFPRTTTLTFSQVWRSF